MATRYQRQAPIDPQSDIEHGGDRENRGEKGDYAVDGNVLNGCGIVLDPVNRIGGALHVVIRERKSLGMWRKSLRAKIEEQLFSGICVQQGYVPSSWSLLKQSDADAVRAIAIGYDLSPEIPSRLPAARPPMHAEVDGSQSRYRPQSSAAADPAAPAVWPVGHSRKVGRRYSPSKASPVAAVAGREPDLEVW